MYSTWPSESVEYLDRKGITAHKIRTIDSVFVNRGLIETIQGNNTAEWSPV